MKKVVIATVLLVSSLSFAYRDWETVGYRDWETAKGKHITSILMMIIILCTICYAKLH